MSEASAMRLVREWTSVPVPRVLDAHVQETDNHVIILMEYTDGETLDKAWPGRIVMRSRSAAYCPSCRNICAISDPL